MEQLHSYIGEVFGLVEGLTGIYGAISISAVCYFLIYLVCIRFLRKELLKRKIIVQQVDKFKRSYVLKVKPDIENKEVSDGRMKNLLNYKYRHHPDEYFEQLRAIVVKHKPKPLLAIGALSVQLFVLVSFISYFAMNGHMAESLTFLVAACLFLCILMWNKKHMWLRIVFFLLIVFAYTKLSTDALIFLTVVSALRVLDRAFLFQKEKKTSSL